MFVFSSSDTDRQYFQLAGDTEAEDLKEGLDTFFSSPGAQAASVSASGTPVGSPQVEEVRHCAASPAAASPSLVMKVSSS